MESNAPALVENGKISLRTRERRSSVRSASGAISSPACASKRPERVGGLAWYNGCCAIRCQLGHVSEGWSHAGGGGPFRGVEERRKCRAAIWTHAVRRE